MQCSKEWIENASYDIWIRGEFWRSLELKAGVNGSGIELFSLLAGFVYMFLR